MITQDAPTKEKLSAISKDVWKVFKDHEATCAEALAAMSICAKGMGDQAGDRPGCIAWFKELLSRP